MATQKFDTLIDHSKRTKMRNSKINSMGAGTLVSANRYFLAHPEAMTAITRLASQGISPNQR
jgi:hypothetical protein